MRRTAEIPFQSFSEIDASRQNIQVESSLQRPPHEHDDTLKNSVTFPSYERRSRSADSTFPLNQRRTRHSPSPTSPKASPVYVEATPYHQKSRKFTTYRPVHQFDDENSNNESESEDEFDCEQVAAFLGTFLEDEEDDFLD